MVIVSEYYLFLPLFQALALDAKVSSFDTFVTMSSYTKWANTV